MDPYDGAIQALVSRPDFDPTLFLKPIMPTQWQELQDNKPFVNRAFHATYPPGSIFKLVTTSAALENNLITTESRVYCKGFVWCGVRKSYCHVKHGHGELTACQALAQSCNILFYDIAKKIDIDCLAHYATMFGLGQRTNVIFSEKTGLVPTRAWKQQTKGERWWRGETLSAAIGQSYLLVTPIQAARMIASIFTGYLVNPRILVNEPVVKKELEIKKSTLAFLQQSMRSVVTTGTGQKVGYVKDLVIYAKTSTAQTSALEKREMGNPYLEHGWLVAHFSYKNRAPHTLIVFAENVGSSRVAASIAKDFLIAYKEHVDSTQDESTHT
jgi:penicillin-binding protein 2